MAEERRCPSCGRSESEHRAVQEAVNRVRVNLGLPPLDPPDIQTGHQRRGDGTCDACGVRPGETHRVWCRRGDGWARPQGAT